MTASKRKITLIAGAALLLIGLPLAWRWTPLSEWASIDNAARWFSQIRSSDVVALWVAACYVASAVLFLPINLLIFVTALFFDDAIAYGYVALGVAINTATGYAIGGLGGPALIRKMSSATLDRVARQLAEADFMDLFLFRLIPVTPFSTINMICGALRMPLLRFTAATFASVAPGATLIILFERSLMAFARNMGWQTGVMLAAALTAIGAGFLLLRQWARRRRAGRGERRARR